MRVGRLWKIYSMSNVKGELACTIRTASTVYMLNVIHHSNKQKPLYSRHKCTRARYKWLE